MIFTLDNSYKAHSLISFFVLRFRVDITRMNSLTALQLMAEGFYSHYRSLHHTHVCIHVYTQLSDIDFELHLFSTASNKSVWNFACRRGLLKSLIGRSLFEIGRRKVWYPKLVYTPYTTIGYRFWIAPFFHSFEPICLKLCM